MNENAPLLATPPRGDNDNEGEIEGTVENPESNRSYNTINCRVCQAPINIENRREQYVVKCVSCNEATPLRPAPSGKKYVRCKCNCLLICKQMSPRVACPRNDCRKIINLATALPPQIPVPTAPGMCRISCANCFDVFLFNRLNNSLAQCPHCSEVSVVDIRYKQTRLYGYVLLAVVLGIFALAITISFADAAYYSQGLYVLFVVLFAFALMSGGRAGYYYKIPVSTIDGV